MVDALNFQNPEHYLGEKQLEEAANHLLNDSPTRQCFEHEKIIEDLRSTPIELRFKHEPTLRELQIEENLIVTISPFVLATTSIIDYVGRDYRARESQQWTAEACRVLEHARREAIREGDEQFLRSFHRPLDSGELQIALQPTWSIPGLIMPIPLICARDYSIQTGLNGSYTRINGYLTGHLLPNVYRDRLISAGYFKKHDIPLVALDGEIFSDPRLDFYSIRKDSSADTPTPADPSKILLTV